MSMKGQTNMIELTEEQVIQLIDTLKNPEAVKTSIALMFLQYLLEGEEA